MWRKSSHLYALADPGGAAGARPPNRINFFVFAYVFAEKCTRRRLASTPPPENPGSATGMGIIPILLLRPVYTERLRKRMRNFPLIFNVAGHAYFHKNNKPNCLGCRFHDRNRFCIHLCEGESDVAFTFALPRFERNFTHYLSKRSNSLVKF